MSGARSAGRAAVFAEEDFVVEIQTFLHGLMEKKGVSRADLARSMGVSRARITQIFSDECKNFTVRLLARAVHALGEAPGVMCRLAEKSECPSTPWEGVFLTAEDLECVWQIKDEFAEIRAQLPCNDQAPKRLVGYSYSPLEWEAA